MPIIKFTVTVSPGGTSNLLQMGNGSTGGRGTFVIGLGINVGNPCLKIELIKIVAQCVSNNYWR
ncbi:MAG: hypothetical protein JNL60_13350 [Bacteroidia bacterium]|nr:hypothetical protein [Bacteroidia bacterium]